MSSERIVAVSHKSGVEMTSGALLLYGVVLFSLISAISYYISEVIRCLFSPVALSHPKISLVTLIVGVIMYMISFPFFNRGLGKRDYVLMLVIFLGISIGISLCLLTSLICPPEIVFWALQMVFIINCLMTSMCAMSVMVGNYSVQDVHEIPIIPSIKLSVMSSLSTSWSLLVTFLKGEHHGS